MKRSLVFLLILFSPIRVLGGDEVSTEPVLRVETGMHTGIIRHIAADASGRFLVTSSDDKTVRVWSLATSELLRTFRPPIRPSDPVQAFSVAVSPDGETIAVGGGTAEATQATPIYMFSRSTGLLLRRIQVWQTSSTIQDLTFSPDGKRLAVVLDTGGIGILKASEGNEVGWDHGCEGGIRGLDFSSLGRVATSCEDGLLRLYESNLKELAKTSTGGKQPWGVHFSSDGKRLAVGHRDEARVEVFSGTDLKKIFSTIDNQNKNALFEVSWTHTGQKLCALRDRRDPKDQSTVRCWPEIGLENPQDFPVGTTHPLFNLVPLPGRRLAFSTGDPGWGILNVDNGVSSLQTAQATDFHGIDLNFRIDQTGSRVQFAYTANDRTLPTFSVEDRSLEVNPDENSVLTPPRTQALGLRVLGWKDHSEPSVGLNGKTLKLSSGDRSQSIAMDPDGRFFFLGTNLYIYSYRDDGTELWKRSVPGSVWALNLSGDRQLVVAAFSDGTIRWYRVDNGQELLAFFPHADRKRWVAWTPSGYYDTSVGGEELIGWYVNRGPDEAADWFPISQFREQYYRPDVISKILTTRDERETLAALDTQRRSLVESPAQKNSSQSVALTPEPEANKETQQQLSQPSPFTQPLPTQLLPPVVTLLNSGGEKETQETSLTFQVAVRSPSGEPVTSVRAYVDGRPVGTPRGLVSEPASALKSGAEKTYDISVPIPPRDCTVAILAETRFAISAPVAVKVRRGAVPPVPERPTLYLLAVGVGTYKNPDFKLDFPAKDAQDIVSAWKRQEGGLYKKVEARLLTDKEATQDAILSGLEWLETQVTQKDMAVLFFAGHGVNDPRSGDYQFLPWEADLNARRTTLLPDREVISVLAGLPGKVLLFLDTCYSGNLLGGLKTRDTSDLTRLINELTSADNGVVVFASSTGRQRSAESLELKNGFFTKAVVEALEGKADRDEDRSIRITEIESYVSQRVKELGGLQTPVSHKPGGVPDFPVAVAGRP